MHWPKFVVENNDNRYSLVKIGLLTVLFFIAANIILRYSINKSKKQLAAKTAAYAKKIKLETKCPDERAGNPDAKLTIKYFYSPVCFWCILEDTHFDELLQKEGQAFKLEKYNRENCDDIMQKYKLSLTPGFIFSTKGDAKEYTVDGYISKANLIKVICDVTGSCLTGEPSSDDQSTKGRSPSGQKIKINFK